MDQSKVTPACVKDKLSAKTPAAIGSHALATSTPRDVIRGEIPASNIKPDVSQLFQSIGSKLGWFDHGDLDEALKKLSKSSKKKSNKSRREKANESCQMESQNCSSKRKTKSKQEKSFKDKENDNKLAGLKKLKGGNSPLAEIQTGNSLDEFEVPLRRTPAHTDLTSKISSNWSAGLSEKPGGVSPTSDCQSDSPSFDLGKPIKESTRIHSRKSIDNILDNTNISEVSMDSLSNSNDDSYKQLHILKKEPKVKVKEYSEIEDKICSDLQDLKIKGQRSVKNNEKVKGLKGANSAYEKINDQLYVTAVEKSDSGDSDGAFKSVLQESSSFESLRSHNKTQYLDCNSIGSCKSDSSNSHKDETKFMSVNSSRNFSLNSDTSYFEVEDVSVQVSHDENKLVKSTSSVSGSVDESLIEVNDASQQTSICNGISLSSYTTKKSPIYSSKNVSKFSNHCQSRDDSNVSSKSNDRNFKDSDIQGKLTKEDSESNNSMSHIEFNDVSVKSSSSIPSPQVNGRRSSDSSCHSEDRFVEVRDLSVQCDTSDPSPQKNGQSLNNSGCSSEGRKREADKTVYFDLSDNSNESTKSEKGLSSSGSSHFKSFCNDFVDSDHSNQTKYFSDDDKSSELKNKHGNDSDEQISKSSDDQTQYFDVKEFDCHSDQSESLNRNGSNRRTYTSGFEQFSRKNKICGKSPKVEDFVEISYEEISISNNKADIKLNNKKLTRLNRNPKTDNSSKTEKIGLRKPHASKHDGIDDSLSDPSDSDVCKTDVQKWRKTDGYHSDSSSDDDDLEAFYKKMRTPAKKSSHEHEDEDELCPDNSLKDFIVDDSDVSNDEKSDEEDDEMLYISTNQVLDSTNKRKPDQKLFIDVDSEESDDVNDKVYFDCQSSSTDEDFKTGKVKPKKKIIPKEKKTSSKICRPTDSYRDDKPKEPNKNDKPKEIYKYGFLKSLSSDLPEHKCDQEALRYVKTFKKTNDELVKRLFRLYNETVFDHKLPEDLAIIWNKRLLRTAGYCKYKKSVRNSIEKRMVSVELSTKVCDTAERVRDTLIHELCHAAVWVVNGKNDGHGPYWKYWAKKANIAHPEIPVIARCHNYSITTKYTYECSKCGYRIGRHSKSLDTAKKVCGYCHGQFILLDNTGRSASNNPAEGIKTPKTPNRFAMFVKENYGSIKKTDKTLKHGEIMNLLSKQFAEKNNIG